MVEIRDEIFRVPVGELVAYARNARTHSDEQIDQLAASMREWGWTNPVLVDDAGGIIAGHGRVLAATRLGMSEVPVLVARGWTEAQKRAYVIADNKLAMNAGWDEEMLAEELAAISGMDFDLDLVGFSLEELAELLPNDPQPSGGDGPEPEPPVPPVPDVAVSKPGDVWLLDGHVVMCGDSTSADDVARLMGGQIAQLLHADPPYGMGKEADGVVNDNLYIEKLDAFQMAWWSVFRPHLVSNASAYIWGNAPDLWRLWYRFGLDLTERFELRNEIVWDKKSIAGMASPDLTQFPTASERCLFFQFGNQFMGNVNADDFPDSWEPLRSYMEDQAGAAGVAPPDVKRVCGCGMYSHWFTRSQFTLIPRKHYGSLAAAYPGRFLRPWAEMKAEWDRVKGRGRDVINGKLDGVRSYFDNAHSTMRDVWEFSRVSGDERFGHATPKPVAMMERVMKSSLPPGGVCAEPFAGSGSTLIGAERTGRLCRTMELQPKYVDVVVLRWQAVTGKQATLAGSGKAFSEIAVDRA